MVAMMAATTPLAGPVARGHSSRFSPEDVAAATSAHKDDACNNMIVYFRDFLLSRIHAVEELACELHSQKEHVPASNRTQHVAGLPGSKQGHSAEPFLSHQATALPFCQGVRSQELISQHRRFHVKPSLACKQELRPIHHAARRIARAWRLSKWRRTFVHFSEMEVGYVGSLAWLEPRDVVFGGELADEDDTQHWMLQHAGAVRDKEVDPWGHHALRAHLLGLPRVEDDSIDRRLRLPRARPKKQHRQHSQVSTLVAHPDKTSQRMLFHRQQQQQKRQQQQDQHLQTQGSIVWR